jgi:hypothetical protein
VESILTGATRRARGVVIGAILMGLATSACELGEADVVNRSPDLGPTVGLPPTTDAPTLANGLDAAGGGGGSADDASVLADTRDAALPRAETASADATDAPTTAKDGASRGEVGSRCADPRLALCEDFEDGATGWEWTGKDWAVLEDATSVETNAVFGPTVAEGSRAIFTQARWQDVTVEVRVRVLAFGQPTNANRAEVFARYQTGDQLYAASLRGDGKLGLRKNASAIGSAATVSVSEGEWHTLGIRVSGVSGAIAIEVHLDGKLVAVATDTDPAQGGPSSALGFVGLGVYGETMAVFDDLKVSSP